ncbi:MAG: hypothetical protein LC808_39335, partial [Actinobacteria bacterium]|nr:hypothetical protein [Actinomycetota bacterium]
ASRSCVEVLRKALAGKRVVDAEEVFEVERTVAHGHVAAAHAMASQLRFDDYSGRDAGNVISRPR